MKTIRQLLISVVLLASSVSAGGCSAARATFNPAAGWAITEPTPMTVVVLRSRVAADVTGHTDRLLRSLPATQASGDALVMDEAEARTMLQHAGHEPTYAGLPVRVVPAEAWKLKLSAACAESDDGGGLMEALGPEVATTFGAVDARSKAVAKTKAELAVARRDARKADGDEKTGHKARAAELKETLAAGKDELKPMLVDLLEQIEAASASLDPAAVAEIADVTYNLLAAVTDAESANAAAILRYPMALPKITDDLQRSVGRFAADVIEEQTGQRPDSENMQITVALDGTEVKFEIAGLDQESTGDLDMAAVLKETSARTQAYVVEVFTLPGRLNETAERLRFQKRVLKAAASGFERPAQGVTAISKLKVTGAEAAAAPEQEPTIASCDADILDEL